MAVNAAAEPSPAASRGSQGGSDVTRLTLATTPHALPGSRSIGWIEVGRIMAIVAVIAIHVVSPLVTRPGHPESWWLGNLVQSTSRWSVPVFVMISGALILRSRRTAQLGEFYRRRLRRLGIPMVFWIAAFLTFGHLVSNTPPTLHDALVSVAAGRPYYHLWFLFVIGGLAIIAPLLAWAVQTPGRPLLAFVAAAYVLAIVANILTTMGIGQPNAVTRFGPYLAEFLAGFALLTVASTPGRARTAIVVLIAGVVLTAIGTWFLVQPEVLGPGRGLYLYEYHSITTVPVSLAIYLLLMWSGPHIERHLTDRRRQLLMTVGAATFGVYLIHPMTLVGLGRLGVSATMTFAPLAVAFTVASAFAISLVAVLAIQRVPWVRALV
jgi:surface polysaccharide O-acyltransferase-like enzyme